MRATSCSQLEIHRCNMLKCEDKLSKYWQSLLCKSFWQPARFNLRKQWILNRLRNLQSRRVSFQIKHAQDRKWLVPDLSGRLVEVTNQYFLRTVAYKWDSVYCILLKNYNLSRNTYIYNKFASRSSKCVDLGRVIFTHIKSYLRKYSCVKKSKDRARQVYDYSLLMRVFRSFRANYPFLAAPFTSFRMMFHAVLSVLAVDDTCLSIMPDVSLLKQAYQKCDLPNMCVKDSSTIDNNPRIHPRLSTSQGSICGCQQLKDSSVVANSPAQEMNNDNLSPTYSENRSLITRKEQKINRQNPGVKERTKVILRLDIQNDPVVITLNSQHDDTDSDRQEVSASVVKKRMMGIPSYNHKIVPFHYNTCNTRLQSDPAGIKHTLLPVCRCKRKCFSKFSEPRTGVVCQSFFQQGDYAEEKKWMMRHIQKLDEKQWSRQRRNYFLTDWRGRRVKVCSGYFQRVLWFANGSLQEPLIGDSDNHHHHMAGHLQDDAVITGHQRDSVSIVSFPGNIDRDCNHGGFCKMDQNHGGSAWDIISSSSNKGQNLDTSQYIHIDDSSNKGQNLDTGQYIHIDDSSKKGKNLDTGQYIHIDNSSNKSCRKDVAKNSIMKLRNNGGFSRRIFKKDKTKESVTKHIDNKDSRITGLNKSIAKDCIIKRMSNDSTRDKQQNVVNANTPVDACICSNKDVKQDSTGNSRMDLNVLSVDCKSRGHDKNMCVGVGAAGNSSRSERNKRSKDKRVRGVHICKASSRNQNKDHGSKSLNNDGYKEVGQRKSVGNNNVYIDADDDGDCCDRDLSKDSSGRVISIAGSRKRSQSKCINEDRTVKSIKMCCVHSRSKVKDSTNTLVSVDGCRSRVRRKDRTVSGESISNSGNKNEMKNNSVPDINIDGCRSRFRRKDTRIDRTVSDENISSSDNKNEMKDSFIPDIKIAGTRKRGSETNIDIQKSNVREYIEQHYRQLGRACSGTRSRDRTVEKLHHEYLTCNATSRISYEQFRKMCDQVRNAGLASMGSVSEDKAGSDVSGKLRSVLESRSVIRMRSLLVGGGRHESDVSEGRRRSLLVGGGRHESDVSEGRRRSLLVGGGRHESDVPEGRRRSLLVGSRRYESEVPEGRRSSLVGGGRHESEVPEGRRSSLVGDGRHESEVPEGRRSSLVGDGRHESDVSEGQRRSLLVGGGRHESDVSEGRRRSLLVGGGRHESEVSEGRRRSLLVGDGRHESEVPEGRRRSLLVGGGRHESDVSEGRRRSLLVGGGRHESEVPEGRRRSLLVGGGRHESEVSKGKRRSLLVDSERHESEVPKGRRRSLLVDGGRYESEVPEGRRRSTRITRMRSTIAEEDGLLQVGKEDGDVLVLESAHEDLHADQQTGLGCSKTRLTLHSKPRFSAKQSLGKSEKLMESQFVISCQHTENSRSDKHEINVQPSQLNQPSLSSRRLPRNKNGSCAGKKCNTSRHTIKKKIKKKAIKENICVKLTNDNGEHIKSYTNSKKLRKLSTLNKKHKHPMLPPCNCSRRRCIENIPEERRREIHDQFWNLSSYKDRKRWLRKYVEKRERKNKVLSLFPQRKNEHKRYFLPDDKSNVVEVCRLFFIHTLGFKWDSVVDAVVRTKISTCDAVVRTKISTCDAVGHTSHQLKKLPRQLPNYVVESVTEYLISVRNSCDVTNETRIKKDQAEDWNAEIVCRDDQANKLPRLKVKDLFKSWKIKYKSLKFNLGYHSFRRIFQSIIDPVLVSQEEVTKDNQKTLTKDVCSIACADVDYPPLSETQNAYSGITDHQEATTAGFSEKEFGQSKPHTNVKVLSCTESINDSNLTISTKNESENLKVDSKSICQDDECINLKTCSGLHENLPDDDENCILDVGSGLFKRADSFKNTSRYPYTSETKYKKRRSMSMRNDRSNYPVLPPCKCRKRKCAEKFTESQRQQINTMFWDLGSYNERKQWILEHIKRADIKRRIVLSQGTPRKLESRWYYLPDADGNKVDVCKGFFLRTLGYRWDSVIDTIGKTTPKGVKWAAPDRRGRKPPPHKISDEAVASMALYIENVCNTYQPGCHKRSQDDIKECKSSIGGQIPYGLTMKQLFVDYKSKHPNHKFGYESFRKIFRRVHREFVASLPPNLESNEKPGIVNSKMNVSDDKDYPVNSKMNISDDKDYLVNSKMNVSDGKDYPVNSKMNVSDGKDYPVNSKMNVSDGKDCSVNSKMNVSHDKDYPVNSKMNVSDDKDYPVGDTCSVEKDSLVDKDCSMEKDYSVDEDYLVRTDYPVGKYCSFEKDYSIGKDCSLEKDYSVGKDCSLEKDYPVGKECSLEKDYPVGKDCSVEKDYLIGKVYSVRTDYPVGKDCSVEQDYSVHKDYSEATNEGCSGSFRHEDSHFASVVISYSETNLHTPTQPAPTPLPPPHPVPETHHPTPLPPPHPVPETHHQPTQQHQIGSIALEHRNCLYQSHHHSSDPQHRLPVMQIPDRIEPLAPDHYSLVDNDPLMMYNHNLYCPPTGVSGHFAHVGDHLGHMSGVNPHTNIDVATCGTQSQFPTYFVSNPEPLRHQVYQMTSQYQSVLHHIAESSRFFSYGYPPAENTFQETNDKQNLFRKQDFHRNNVNCCNIPKTFYNYVSEPASVQAPYPPQNHLVYTNAQESTTTILSPYSDENDKSFAQDHQQIPSATHSQDSVITGLSNGFPCRMESKESASKVKIPTKKSKSDKQKVKKEMKMKPKSLRNYGDHYPMLGPCNCKKKKCTEKFSEKARQKLHDMFWGLKDYNERKQWMLQHIKREDCKRRRIDQFESFRKLESRWYFFPDEDGKQHEICKDFFLRTLGYKWDSVIDTIRRTTPKGETTTRPDQRGRKAPAHKLSSAVLRSVVQYIKSMQQLSQPLNEHVENVEDSNCEQSNEHTIDRSNGQIAVPYGLTMKDLYDDYKVKHAAHKIGYESFRRIFRALSKSEKIIFDDKTSEDEFLGLNDQDLVDF